MTPLYVGLLAVGDSKTADDAWVGLVVSGILPTMFAYEVTPRAAVPGHTTAEMRSDIDTFLAGVIGDATVVIMNLGANDIAGVNGSVTELAWKDDYRYILNAIIAKWPAILIYCARVWRQGYDSQSDIFNSWVDDVVAEYDTNVYVGMDERVWFAPNVATYSNDGIHYNSAGQQPCADAWLYTMGH